MMPTEVTTEMLDEAMRRIATIDPADAKGCALSLLTNLRPLVVAEEERSVEARRRLHQLGYQTIIESDRDDMPVRAIRWVDGHRETISAATIIDLARDAETIEVIPEITVVDVEWSRLTPCPNTLYALRQAGLTLTKIDMDSNGYLCAAQSMDKLHGVVGQRVPTLDDAIRSVIAEWMARKTSPIT